MKKVKLFAYRSRITDLSDLQRSIGECIKQNGPASHLTVSNGSEPGDFLVTLSFDGLTRGAQDVLISNPISVDCVEQFVDALCETRKVQQLAVYANSHSARYNVVVALMESSSVEEEKPYAHGHVGAISGAESGIIGSDRGVDAGRTSVDDSSLHPEVRRDAREKAGSVKGRSRKRN